MLFSLGRRVLLALAWSATAADYAAPAGNRLPFRSLNGESILPGGRILHPLGRQYLTGPEPFGLAVNPAGNILVTANRGPERYSLTVLEKDKDRGGWISRHLVAPRKTGPEGDDDDGRSVFMGIAFAGNNSVWASDGDSGSVRLIQTASGNRRKSIDLNQGGFKDSYTSDLALDNTRGLLYVVDQANSRMVVADIRRGRVVSSVKVGKLPFAIALSPDARRAYVTDLGANSLAAIDVSDPAAPKVERFLATGRPWGPSAVLAADGRIFVNNAHDDSIRVIDAGTLAVTAEIPIRVPGLEGLRGVLPLGMALNRATGWLLVAEAGINAVGVIDPAGGRVLGHLPAGWFPTRVVVDRDNVYVSSAKGVGVGPNAASNGVHYLSPGNSFMGTLERGIVSMYPMPDASELAAHTKRVMEFNGLAPRAAPAALPPAAIRRVVLIVKGNRTFDEVFGDIVTAADGPVRSAPLLARFGRIGNVYGGSQRLSFKGVNVTPNHHSMASRWAISDNFHADSQMSADLSRHLERAGITFRNYGEGFEPAGAGVMTGIPDQFRADAFIREVRAKYLEGGEAFPRFLFIHLPNDRTAKPRPEDGYAYEASYVADNDYALGRIIEFLSATPWWKEMAVFVTEAGAQGGRDHVDAHRTVLMALGPYVKKGYVSRVNAGFPGLLKTLFRVFGMAPVHLSDAAASDLSDVFTAQPDFTPYKLEPVDERLFAPRNAREQDKR